jgi:K+-transporting ATPase KdpF subunit
VALRASLRTDLSGGFNVGFSYSIGLAMSLVLLGYLLYALLKPERF